MIRKRNYFLNEIIKFYILFNSYAIVSILMVFLNFVFKMGLLKV